MNPVAIDIDITDAEADQIDAARGWAMPDLTLDLLAWLDEDGNLEVRARPDEEAFPLPESVLDRIEARLDERGPTIRDWLRRREAAERSMTC